MGDAVEECKALAERLGAPVVNGYLRNDSFPASHPLWGGPLGYQGSKAAMKLIAQADVVIALGSRMGPFGTLPQHGMDYWPKDAKIIQVEADHTNLGLVKKITVGICGDAKAAAVALTQRLDGRRWPATPPRPRAPRPSPTEKAAWEKELDEWTHERDAYSLDMIEEQKRATPAATGCTRARCCASSRRRCRRTSWSRPTSATSTRWPTATCASRSRAPSSRR